MSSYGQWKDEDDSTTRWRIEQELQGRENAGQEVVRPRDKDE